MIPEDAIEEGGCQGGKSQCQHEVWGSRSPRAAASSGSVPLQGLGARPNLNQLNCWLRQQRHSPEPQLSGWHWLKAASHTPCPLSRLSVLCDQEKGSYAESRGSSMSSLWGWGGDMGRIATSATTIILFAPDVLFFRLNSPMPSIYLQPSYWPPWHTSFDFNEQV